jgi:hypothetical protein
MDLHLDVIIVSSSFSNWKSLDEYWSFKFLREGEKLGMDLKKKVQCIFYFASLGPIKFLSIISVKLHKNEPFMGPFAENANDLINSVIRLLFLKV